MILSFLRNLWAQIPEPVSSNHITPFCQLSPVLIKENSFLQESREKFPLPTLALENKIRLSNY
jgi:hypothetical protein